ncbi:phosphoserine aminotransferase [Raphidocelis subcapitata]|uniref:phosphoserine transaminase n=1 Tax=Raphidocelis subcapitata TaxID=307507 RepID=A0A2V0PE69_9CHLO|nr:phosphoserine aminotransferase [Raphidocelis subcapitata]|eukprot:GBF98148.1 phosphoserine aminotransferase [Raphidocelis subcapitata]
MATNRVFNFAAGPACLPLEVLEQAQADLVSYQGSGMSVMEMSHRSKEFEGIIKSAEADLRKLLDIPDNYKVLFVQGGASTQFAAIPFNFTAPGDAADYVVTGAWSKKAYEEALKLGLKANLAAKGDNKSIPPRDSWKLTPGAKYVHYCDNETIGGVEFPSAPDVGDVPLIADMSSDFLSKPVDVSKYAMIYAGAQKNVGPAGVVIAIVREDLLGHARPDTPTMLDYKVAADNGSMYNTPPCWTIYICGLELKGHRSVGGMRASIYNAMPTAGVEALAEFMGAFRKKHAKASRINGAACRRVTVRSSAVGAPAIEASRHSLPDGSGLEVLHLAAADASKAAARPPLVFVHGSYHAAWCWKENFMPYFSAAGYDCFALSLRCQGGSDRPAGAKVAGNLDSLAADLGSYVSTFPRPPVLVTHSFSGLIAQKYLLTPSAPAVAGAAFLCSVPPSGNKAMVGRFLRRDFFLSMRITWAFVGRSFATSLAACREAFFSPELPEADLKRYQAELAAASPVRLLDLKDMTKQVPLPQPRSAPPRFVLGGELDKVVDVEAVQELAAYCGVPPVVLPGLAHDCMLDARWRDAADALRGWLDGL